MPCLNTHVRGVLLLLDLAYVRRHVRHDAPPLTWPTCVRLALRASNLPYVPTHLRLSHTQPAAEEMIGGRARVLVGHLRGRQKSSSFWGVDAKGDVLGDASGDAGGTCMETLKGTLATLKETLATIKLAIKLGTLVWRTERHVWHSNLRLRLGLARGPASKEGRRGAALAQERKARTQARAGAVPPPCGAWRSCTKIWAPVAAARWKHRLEHPQHPFKHPRVPAPLHAPRCPQLWRSVRSRCKTRKCSG